MDALGFLVAMIQKKYWMTEHSLFYLISENLVKRNLGETTALGCQAQHPGPRALRAAGNYETHFVC